MTSLFQLKAAMAASPVPFRFMGTGSGQYQPIYLAAGEHPGRLASANAGNSSVFFVGGGGLNQIFSQQVANPNAYTALQTALFNQATSTFSYSSYPASEPVQFAMVRRPAAGSGFFNYEGTVFVDVFQPGTTPAGNPDNYAMAYVCPPMGSNYAGPADFLAAVQATAVNLVDAVRHYNQVLVPAAGSAGTGGAASIPDIASIDLLRVFLFSSGIFLQPATTVAQVAQAVCSGLVDGLAQGATGLAAIELPDGMGEYSAVAPASGT